MDISKKHLKNFEITCNSTEATKKENFDNFLSLNKIQTNPVDKSKGNPLDAIEKMYAETEIESPPRQVAPLSKHQCRNCRKHFSSSSALQIHMRTHTGLVFFRKFNLVYKRVRLSSLTSNFISLKANCFKQKFKKFFNLESNKPLSF